MIKHFCLIQNLNLHFSEKVVVQSDQDYFQIRELNKIQESIEQCDKALQIDSNYIEALWSKGETLAFVNKYSESIKYFDQVLFINSRFIHALKGKSHSLFKLNLFEKSLELQEKILEIDPKNVEAQNRKREILNLQNQYYYKIQQNEEVIKSKSQVKEIKIKNELDIYQKKEESKFESYVVINKIDNQ